MNTTNPNTLIEQDQGHSNQELVDTFLEFCQEELGYSTPVEVNLVYDRDDLTTLASYNYKDYVVNVYAKDRGIADILRSIAHELVHHLQNEEGRIDGSAPDIGGDIEDEANAVAGQLVKKFGYENMNIYEQHDFAVSTISNEKTDRELCDNPEEGEFFCLAGSENLGTTDIYKDDGYNLIHQFAKPYHLSDVTPDEEETYHEPGAKKVKKTVLKPKLTAPFNIPITEQDEQINLFPTGEWEFPVGWEEDDDYISDVKHNVPEPLFKKIMSMWDQEGIDFSIFKLLGIRPDTVTNTYVLKRYIQNTTKPIPVSYTFDCNDLKELFDRNNNDYDLSYIPAYLCGDDNFWDHEDWYNYEWDDYMTDTIDENNWKTISEIFGGVPQSDAEDILNKSSSSEEVDELIEKYDEEIDEIQNYIVWAYNDEHEYAIKHVMAKDIEDKLEEHFQHEGHLHTDDNGSKSWTIEGDLRDYVNDQWDNTDTFEYHTDHVSQPLEDMMLDYTMGSNLTYAIFSALIEEEYAFWEYCEGKQGECLQPETKWFDGYWHPDVDINESLSDRLNELTYVTTVTTPEGETTPLHEQEDPETGEDLDSKLDDNYAYVESQDFTKDEIRILNNIAQRFTLEELTTIATQDDTQFSNDIYDKWKDLLKLFGEDTSDNESYGKSTRFAKWIVDNYAGAASEDFGEEELDFGRVTNPIKAWPSVYYVEGTEDGWEQVYRTGQIEIVAFDREDAEERAADSWWEYEPDMETTDYGDYDSGDFEIDDVSHSHILREGNVIMSYRELNNEDIVILNKITKQYSLNEINDLLNEPTTDLTKLLTIKESEGKNLKNYLEFITNHIWPNKGDYTNFTGKIITDILSEQMPDHEPETDDDAIVRGEPFNQRELTIMKLLHQYLSKDELTLLVSNTPNNYGKSSAKFWEIMKLVGITIGNQEDNAKASVYAKLVLDNWREDGDYANVDNPIRTPLKWYHVDREETGSQIEYKVGDATLLAYDFDDAEEKGDEEFYDWDGEMETNDYGDYEMYDSDVSDVRLAESIKNNLREQTNELDDRTKALISIGGIQRDKVTTPKFIKNIFKSSGHEAKSSGMEPEDGEEWNTFYTPGTNIDLNSDVQRVRDRIRFEEYGEMFQQGIEGRGFAFEGMLAGLFNGEPMEAGGKEDIKIGNDYYSIKQSNPGDAWDTGSLQKGYNFAREKMVQEGFSEEEIPPTPVDLMVAGDEYIPHKAQMLTESFKASNGQSLKWIFAHVLDAKHIEYDVLDSDELISAILSSDCSKGTRSQECAIGQSRKSDTGLRIKSRFVLGDPKMITFPTVSEDDIKSIIYNPEGDRVEDKIRRIFRDPTKVSQYTVDYIKNNPQEFQDAVNAILPDLTNEERNIAYNLLLEETDVFGQGLLDPIEPEEFEGEDEEWDELVSNVEDEEFEVERDYEYTGGKTDPAKGFVAPSAEVTNNICNVEGFCSAQGPITFGQLKSLVEEATKKRIQADMGRGVFKTLWRIIPFFIPQILLAAVGITVTRAINKIVTPALTDTRGYKSWWGKAVLKAMDIAEGDYIPDVAIGDDPLSKIFFISDGLLQMIRDKYKLKFARYVADVAASEPDNKPVPEWFVENLLRDYLNQKFLLDPPLPIKHGTESEEITESYLPLDQQAQKKAQLTPQIFSALDEIFSLYPHEDGELNDGTQNLQLYSHELDSFVPIDGVFGPIMPMIEGGIAQEDVDMFVNIITDWLNQRMNLKIDTSINEGDESKNPFGFIGDDWKDELLNHEKNLSANELKYKKLADQLDRMAITIPVDISDGEEPVIGTTDITFTLVRPYIFQGLRGDFFDGNPTDKKPKNAPTVIRYDLVFMGVEPGSFLEELLEDNSLEGREGLDARERLMELLDGEAFEINGHIMTKYFKLYGLSIGRLGKIYDSQTLKEQTDSRDNWQVDTSFSQETHNDTKLNVTPETLTQYLNQNREKLIKELTPVIDCLEYNCYEGWKKDPDNEWDEDYQKKENFDEQIEGYCAQCGDELNDALEKIDQDLVKLGFTQEPDDEGYDIPQTKTWLEKPFPYSYNLWLDSLVKEINPRFYIDSEDNVAYQEDWMFWDENQTELAFPKKRISEHQESKVDIRIKKFLTDFWPQHRNRLYSKLYNTYHPSTYTESFNRPSGNFEDALETIADAVHDGKKLGLLDSSVDWSDIVHYDDNNYSTSDLRLIDDDGIPTLNDKLEIMDNTNLDWVHGVLLFDVLEEIVDEFKHYCGENGIDESGMGKCMDEFPPSPVEGTNKPENSGTLKQDYYTLFNFMRELERAGVPVTDYLKDPTYPSLIKLVDDGTTDYDEEGKQRKIYSKIDKIIDDVERIDEHQESKLNPELMIGDEILVVSTEGIHDFGEPELYEPYVVVGLKHGTTINREIHKWTHGEEDEGEYEERREKTRSRLGFRKEFDTIPYTYYQIEPIGMTDEERTGAMLAGGGRMKPMYIFPSPSEYRGSDQWILRPGFLRGEHLTEHKESGLNPELEVGDIIRIIDIDREVENNAIKYHIPPPELKPEKFTPYAVVDKESNGSESKYPFRYTLVPEDKFEDYKEHEKPYQTHRNEYGEIEHYEKLLFPWVHQWIYADTPMANKVDRLTLSEHEQSKINPDLDKGDIIRVIEIDGEHANMPDIWGVYKVYDVRQDNATQEFYYELSGKTSEVVPDTTFSSTRLTNFKYLYNGDTWIPADLPMATNVDRKTISEHKESKINPELEVGDIIRVIDVEDGFLGEKRPETFAVYRVLGKGGGDVSGSEANYRRHYDLIKLPVIKDTRHRIHTIYVGDTWIYADEPMATGLDRETINEHKQNLNPPIQLGDVIRVIDVDKVSDYQKQDNITNSAGNKQTRNVTRGELHGGDTFPKPMGLYMVMGSPLEKYTEDLYWNLYPVKEPGYHFHLEEIGSGSKIMTDKDTWMLVNTDQRANPDGTLIRSDKYTIEEALNDLVYRDEPRDKHIRRMGKELGSLEGFPIERFKKMPPPSNESDETEEEIGYLEEIPVDKNLIDSADETRKHFTNFLTSVGLTYPKEELKEVMGGVQAIILKLKYHYNRPRPWQIAQAKGLELNSEALESSSSPSYPSGHATQGRFIAKYLSDLYPEYRDELMQIGEDVAYSRNMAKVHYPTDSAFGKFLADEMYDYVYQPQEELETELDEYCPMGKPNKCTVVNYKELPDTLQESYVQRIINTPLTCEERELGPRP